MKSIKKIVKENGDVFFTNDSNTCKFFAIIYQLPYTHIIIKVHVYSGESKIEFRSTEKKT